MHTVAGTPFYMAPEVLLENYGTKADIWSLGVLLYTLVSGYLPFQGSNNRDVFARIKNADFHFDHKEFSVVSKECKDLIGKLLVVSTKKRFDGKQALNHPWFEMHRQGKLSNEANLDNNVIARLKSYKGESLFKRAAMNMLVKMASSKEVDDLRKQFEAIDKDGTGMILEKELHDVIKKKQLNMSDKEVSDLIAEVDYQGNGKINYSEFLSATIDLQTFLDEQKLLAVFNQFDTDRSGKITEDNIYYAMQKLGMEVPMSEIRLII